MSDDDSDRIARIRERAYHLWERGHHGHAADHWLTAEREIDAETTAAPAATPAATTKTIKKAARAAAAAQTSKSASTKKPAKPAKPPKRKPKTQETHVR